MLVTTSRDKKLRFWDVRQEKPAYEVPGHGGAKNSRVVWMGEHDRVATTGFSKMSERQLGLWDTRNPEKPLGDFMPLDSGSGVEMPFWDDSCQILYLGGKGDGNIRYYEYQNDKFEYLSEYRSPNPQRGIAFMPKRGVNTHENEIMRAFKTVDDLYIEPISFVVPRRAETFQEDIYPPVIGTQPAMSSPEWLGGKAVVPPKLSMEDIYEGNEPRMIAADPVPEPSVARAAPEPTPVSVPTPSSPLKQETKPDPIPAPASSARTVPQTMDKRSMSDMASKFADKDEDDDEEEDSSSFEEIQKPVERPSVAAAKQQSKSSEPEPSMTTSAPPPEPQQTPTPISAATPAPPTESKQDAKAVDTSGSAPVTASSAAGGLRDILHEIRGMLQTQGKQIEHLASEVASLKAKVES